MRKIYLSLAFDHELSLGGVKTSYADNLFDPTEAILTEASALDVPITLFTDVLAGVRFRSWNVSDFYEPYEQQLRRSLELGHDVQLHLHPHWLDTELKDGRIKPSTRYELAEFAMEPPPRDITGIVTTGVNYLNQVCRAAKPAYRCIAFRAGGFCIQRATPAILDALWQAGIRIDSSIPPGYRFDSDISGVDFSDTPKLANWRIGLDGPLNRPSAEGILEVPIATIPRNPLNNSLALAKRVLFRRRWRHNR